jgi:hypothetical protein
VQDARGAVAFAIDGVGRTAGTYTVSLDGQGQTSFAFAPGQRTPPLPAQRRQHRLTVYQHFVSTPVAIGAATSPASMLSPLAVDVKPAS